MENTQLKQKISIDWKDVWGKTVKFLSTVSRVAIVVIALATGFAGGNLYHRYTNSTKVHEMQKTHTEEHTSVALNERGEIMILNRTNGTYEIYSDKVGKMIFDLYAGKMYIDSKN